MITIHQVEYEQKSILRNLLELYKYDFSEFEPDDVNEYGLYEYKYLDHYWTEAERHPFFIKVNGRLAGFALVRELGSTEQNETIYSMAEFFVMKKYRRSGVGRHVSMELFTRFSGLWKVAQVETNEPAQRFWRRTIGEYTHNRFQERREEGWDGPIQVFSTGNKDEVPELNG
jgi:predicted acetyltransferase